MKILIGYDGSQRAEGALADLGRAGLPPKVEAHVLSVSEQWIPAPASIGGVTTPFPESEAAAVQEAQKLARSAKAVLKTIFPQWQVTAESALGSPANILLAESEEWKPDLIIVGSQGHSALGRFFFGSVAQKILHHADRSVRIARATKKEGNSPVRLIVGVDGSPDAENAVREIASRHWPKGSEAHVICGMWAPPLVASEQMATEIESWIAHEKTRCKEAVETATRRLQGIGLITSAILKEADPKHLLCEEAERRDADCIFVGAKGMGAIERVLLGSTSSAVAMRASCSVEVVR
jgi:nucleotide-binding universal stress UspA family protein